MTSVKERDLPGILVGGRMAERTKATVLKTDLLLRHAPIAPPQTGEGHFLDSGAKPGAVPSVRTQVRTPERELTSEMGRGLASIRCAGPYHLFAMKEGKWRAICGDCKHASEWRTEPEANGAAFDHIEATGHQMASLESESGQITSPGRRPGAGRRPSRRPQSK